MINSSTRRIPVEDCLIPQPSISISIVSNSRLMCEALLLLLQVHQTVDLIEHYRGDVDATEGVPNPFNHVVLVDSGIGFERAIARIQQWCEFEPSPSVIVLELENDIDLILACIEAGTSGYALKGASSEEIHQVISQARQGVAQCSPEVTAKLFTRLANLQKSRSRHISPPLTPRELDVLRLIAKGYSDRAIACELVIEICTVKHHVHNLLHKLDVRHRWDAARIAMEQGWLHPE
ncbi:response regulator transcription factor [Cyanobacteria bacterium FACHB-63]|nr:response regulator transcription factor [Cyanobacteria bacterium FACHB-63]